MLALLPILSFILFYYQFLIGSEKEASRFRIAFLLAAVSWGGAVTLGIEFLNHVQAIHLPGLMAFWVAIIGLQCWIIRQTLCKIEGRAATIPKFKKLTAIEGVMVFFIGLFVILVGIVAMNAPPNSYDALNYHMSRVWFWVQNRTVNFYPTPEYRQLYIQPWQGFSFLHFQVLSGSDRFSTLVPYFAYLGCILGASLLAQQFGRGRGGQLFAALFATTIPTAVIEATGVRMDVIVAFWITCMVAFILQLKRTGNDRYHVFIGLACGLAVLTKGTAYLLATPFVVWYGIEAFRGRVWSKAVRGLLLFAVLVLIVNSGFFGRNLVMCGSILGPAELREKIVTHDMTPALYVTNVFRVLLFHLGSRFDMWNEAVMQFHDGIYNFFNLDPNDPRGLWTNKMSFKLLVGNHEDHVSNVVQALLIIVGTGVFAYRGIRKREWSQLIYVVCIIMGLSLLACIMDFHHHISRYQLALFVLAAPVVTVLFNSEGKISKIWAWILILGVTVPSVEYTYSNNLRKLFSSSKATVFNTDRFSMYFRNDSSLKEPYLAAMRHVVGQGCDQVGIYMRFNRWDYPLLVIWRDILKQEGRVEHIGFIHKYAPKNYPLGDFTPCAIVGFVQFEQYVTELPETLEYGGRTYFSVFTSDKAYVYY